MAQPIVPSLFTSNKALLCVGDKKLVLRVLKMDGSTLLFVSNQAPEDLNEMALAMQMPGDKKEVVATILLGKNIINSNKLAEKLCKRFKRQFIVSFNSEVDRLTESLVEKAILDYINNHKEQFA